jgi:hypothetical protein
MRWYNQLVAQKFDGSQKRNKLGRPRVSDEIEALVLQLANDNPTWVYRRIQGSMANLGHRIDKIAVRNILGRHHIDPAPKRRQGGMSGLDNRLIAPEPEVGMSTGKVRRRERLSGLLSYYDCEAV